MEETLRRIVNWTRWYELLVYLFWMKSSDWSIFTIYSTVVRMSPLIDSSFSATIITWNIIQIGRKEVR